MEQLHLHTLRNVKVILPPEPIQVQNQNVDTEPCSLVDSFIELIYKKTGVILVKDSSKAHALIPLNLRALHHTFILLRQLQDVNMSNLYWEESKTDEEKEGIRKNREKLRRNLHQMEHWLVESISSNSVPHELADVFRQAAIHPSAGFCSFLAHQLKHYNKKLTSEKKLPVLGDEAPIQNILNADKPDQTICLGDILFLLDQIMERDSTEGYRHFAAAVKMLISLRVSAYLRTDQSQETSGYNPDYQSVSSLLGSMVVHPNVRLTISGREWLAGCDLSMLRIDNNGKSLYINNREPGEENDPSQTPVQINAVAWLSMFLVTPYRVVNMDYHKPYMKAAWSKRLPFYVDLQKAVNISVHWMRFATATLDPKKEIERLIWMLPYTEKEDAFYSAVDKYIKALEKLRDKMLPLPLHSIDVIHALTTEMNQTRHTPSAETKFLGNKIIRAESRDKTKKDHAITEIYSAEFAAFKEHLTNSYENVLKNTALYDSARKEPCEKFKELINNLKSYSLLDDAKSYLDDLEQFEVFRLAPI